MHWAEYFGLKWQCWTRGRQELYKSLIYTFEFILDMWRRIWNKYCNICQSATGEISNANGGGFYAISTVPCSGACDQGFHVFLPFDFDDFQVWGLIFIDQRIIDPVCSRWREPGDLGIVEVDLSSADGSVLPRVGDQSSISTNSLVTLVMRFAQWIGLHPSIWGNGFCYRPWRRMLVCAANSRRHQWRKIYTLPLPCFLCSGAKVKQSVWKLPWASSHRHCATRLKSDVSNMHSVTFHGFVSGA